MHLVPVACGNKMLYLSTSPHCRLYYNQTPFCSDSQLVKMHPDVEEEVRKQLTHEHHVPCWFTKKKKKKRQHTVLSKHSHCHCKQHIKHCEWCPDHAEDIYCSYLLLLHPTFLANFKTAWTSDCVSKRAHSPSKKAHASTTTPSGTPIYNNLCRVIVSQSSRKLSVTHEVCAVFCSFLRCICQPLVWVYLSVHVCLSTEAEALKPSSLPPARPLLHSLHHKSLFWCAFFPLPRLSSRLSQATYSFGNVVCFLYKNPWMNYGACSSGVFSPSYEHGSPESCGFWETPAFTQAIKTCPKPETCVRSYVFRPTDNRPSLSVP